MPKNCCAVGCSNVYRKGSGIQFYRCPVDLERRNKSIAAVNRQNWNPTEYTWICSEHFVGGAKSNNPLAPNYVPSLFKHIKSPVKRCLEARGGEFSRRQATKRRRAEESVRIENAKESERRARLQEIEEKRKADEVCHGLYLCTHGMPKLLLTIL